MELSAFALALLALIALLSGMSKTGFPGLGIVFVALVPLALPAKESTGYILPFLIFGDVLAIVCWRKAVIWRHITAVLPSTCIGVICGYGMMDRIAGASYGKVLGGIVLVIVALDWLRRRYDIPIPVGNRAISHTLGFLAGVMTMLANAAGPVAMMYLLSMNITKEEFVGTGAWLFFIVNLFKVPFSMSLGLITLQTLKINVMMLPFVLVGGALGLLVMRKISGRAFETAMRSLAFLGGLRLFLQ